MPYVSNNKYLRNIIYFAVFNEHLYVKSNRSDYEYLKKIMLTGVFEDPSQILNPEYNCQYTVDNCVDILDTKIPIESSLIPSIMNVVINDLSLSIYKPEDKNNNANDDLSGLQNNSQSRPTYEEAN